MTSTPIFWIAAAALIALTLVALVWPLMRRSANAAEEAPGEMAAATTIYRDQRRQLDADLAAGAITTDEHAAALDELATRLGAEIALPVPAAPAPASRAPWIAALVLVAVVPTAAVIAYMVLGNPGAMKLQATQAAQAGHDGISEETMRGMVDNLAQRMKDNPADPRGWMLLGRSYAALGRFDEAANAYAQAAERVPAPDAQLYADWADAAAMAQGRKLAGKPEELVERALALEPTNPKALALSGTARLERGDLPGSIRQWRALRAQLAADSDDAREVDSVIAKLEGQARIAGGAPKAAATQPPPLAVAPAAPAPATVAKAGAPTNAAASAVSGRVELDPKLAARVAPDDTVFVLARAAEGPRMPLAVQRFRAAELPRAFRLDDSMSMAPGMTLSAMPKVIVEARVSKSGNAITQPGDLRGTAGPLAPGANDLRIVIGDVVP